MKPVKNTLWKDKIYEEHKNITREWKVDYEEIEIRNEYGVTNTILIGNEKNEPLIFFHDQDVNAMCMWSWNIEELSKYFYCILIEMPGNSEKSIRRTKYSGDFKTNTWVDSVLMELNIEKCYGVGIGRAADLLLDYMHYNPDLKKVICIEGGIPFQKEMSLMSSFESIKLHFKGRQKYAFRYPKTEDHDFIATKSRKDDIYFVFSKNVMEDNNEALVQFLSEMSNVKIIENNGHLIHMEHAGIVNQIIVDFLEGMKSD